MRIEWAKPCLPRHLSRLLPIELAVYRDLQEANHEKPDKVVEPYEADEAPGNGGNEPAERRHARGKDLRIWPTSPVKMSEAAMMLLPRPNCLAIVFPIATSSALFCAHAICYPLIEVLGTYNSFDPCKPHVISDRVAHASKSDGNAAILQVLDKI